MVDDKEKCDEVDGMKRGRSGSLPHAYARQASGLKSYSRTEFIPWRETEEKMCQPDYSSKVSSSKPAASNSSGLNSLEP